MDVFDRIKMLCEQRGISMAEMERGAGLGERSTYNWKRVTPSWDKLEKVADYFGVSIDYLMGREPGDNDDIWEVRERLRNQPGMRMLFDATSKATPEELMAVANMFKAMKGNQNE